MDSVSSTSSRVFDDRPPGLVYLENLISRRDGGEVLPRSDDLNDLSGLYLSGIDLSRLDLSGVNLSRAEMVGCNLAGTRLVGADLTYCIAQRVDLSGCELMGADLTGADLTNARIERAGVGRVKAHGTSFFGAVCRYSTFTGADLLDADFRASDLSGARMRDVSLRNADLEGADLTEVDLSGSDVHGASLRAVMLARAHLRDVSGYTSADWIGADVGEVNFTGAWLLRRHVQDANFIAEFRRQSKTHEVIYRLWWATSDCGRSLVRWGLWTVSVALLYSWLYTLVGVEWGTTKTWLSPVYYSVVTFTTLGYGDVLPGSASAQALAMSQVVLGYFSLGAMMSILADKMARRAG